MMIKSYFSVFIFVFFLAACTNENPKEYDPETGKIFIDGEEWTFVLSPNDCERYTGTAVKEYSKNPIYNASRRLDNSRYLINDEGDCWVEIEVVGASDFYFLFRVDADMKVIDKRMFTERPPYINAYPTEPYED